ncbi:MAG: carbamoyltransferase HypF [Bacteroidetes bacterium]|nr:carbamoyltransferase HypF [Bacteroidota bacterium]
MIKTYKIEIQGLVQGVGFRPFIYRVAIENNLSGSVENRNDGVVIILDCTKQELEKFINIVQSNAPPASSIDSIKFKEIEKTEFHGFEIVKSTSISDSITDVSPDIAVCNDCLLDMKTQPNRIDYPFINCTNCGPRFTIIQDLPYDREKTTMQKFKMCPECNREYTDILDRRFHAQPVACSVCGPEYKLHFKDSKITDQKLIIDKTTELLKNKGIIAIKGLGGFFIACDALCEETVSRLRKLKAREGKPFAVMFSDINTLKQYAKVNEAEEKSLLSLKRPIVLLKEKVKLAPSVNLGFDTIGAMLPYMPLHYLIFEKSDLKVIVLTSGNISDEPIITNNDKAVNILGEICDAVITYNRDIHNRTDDSVVCIMNSKERIFRRSRGYAPSPVKLLTNVNGILATGAELVNCFCIGKDNQAILSQHIGDLKNIETYEFYTESIKKYKKLFRFEPSIIVTDMHPDYLSTRYADEYDLPVMKVQHHHAHIASCMAEHGLDEQVIGIALDGTGLGDDGNIWGSEFFICDYKDYSRITHFEYVPLPGGDKVTHEPWRTAVSYLYKYNGKEFFNHNLEFLKDIPKQNIELICEAIEKKINCPLSSGAGRLFDAVAALINLCTVSKFHAEAPMRLESIINEKNKDSYLFDADEVISFKKTFTEIINDLKKNIPISDISAKFHNTIVNVVIAVSLKIREKHNLNKVVLSGGTFQNKYLSENIEKELIKCDFQVFTHSKIPTNDAGIALGQLMVAASRK